MRVTRSRGHVAQAALAAAVLAAMPAGVAGETGEEAAVPPPEGKVAIASGEGSVTEALQGKEGVRIQTLCTHCNSANIQVGGLNEDLVPVLWDGFPLFGGLATSLVLNMLPPDSVAEATVLKGPGDAGAPSTAVGGTIALEGAEAGEVPWLSALGGAGSFGLHQGTVRLAGEAASWLSGSVCFGRTTADAVDDDGDGWHDVTAVDRDFAAGEIRIRPGSRHRLTVGGSYVAEDDTEGKGGFDIVSYVLSGMGGTPSFAWTREDSLLDRREYRVGWDWSFRRGGGLKLRLLEALRHQSVLSQLTGYQGPGYSNELEERLGIRQRQLFGSLSIDRPLGFAWRVSAGVEAVHDSARARVKDSITPVEEEYLKTWSAYASAGYAPAPGWRLDFGLRWDDDEVFGSQLSPRMSVRVYPASGVMLRLLAGRTFRAPRSIFSEVCCGQQLQRNVLEDGTVLVRPEDAWTVGLEGVYQPSPELRASLYVATTGFEDHILRVVAESRSWIQTYANVNVPHARSETAEVAVTWRPARRWTIEGSLGWLSFRRRGPDVPVATIRRTISLLETVPIPMDRIPYRPDRTGSVGVTYAGEGGYLLSLQANFTGSMLIQHFGDDPLTGASILLPDLVETPGFWLVNLAAEIPLSQRLALVAGAENLTGRIQNDLGDPRTDFNWGPLTGRSWRAAFRVSLDG
ncbi:MAG: TonB-dependent receptor [Acidobacteria bacterium]|nr:MAG: TonB-dependent receptor [Acidobacteriota bacterium]